MSDVSVITVYCSQISTVEHQRCKAATGAEAGLHQLTIVRCFNHRAGGGLRGLIQLKWK